MMNLIKAEFYKLSKSRGYKILILSVLGFSIGLCLITKKDGYFSLTTSAIDIFTHSIFASIFTASFIGSEFMNRTYGMSLCCGSSRRKVFLSKLVVFFIGLLLLLFIYPITITVTTSIKNGFGRELTSETCRELLIRLLYCFIWYIVLGSFFVLISSFIRNKVGIIFIGTLGCYMVLAILVSYEESNKVPEVIKYVLLYQLRLFLNDRESVSYGIFLFASVITFVFSIIASVIIFEKKDLK